jgi:cell division protein FtsB
MRISTLVIAAVLGCAASPALAQAQDPPPLPDAQAPLNSQSPPSPPSPPGANNVPESAPPNVPSRYRFNRVDDGYLRLDNDSGQIAFCSPRSVGWACQAVPEDRAALEKEIARLQDEVARLKREVAALREPPPPRPPAELSPAPKHSDDAVELRKDIERARAAIENAWRRLVDMIVNFQKDMMRKG